MANITLGGPIFPKTFGSQLPVLGLGVPAFGQHTQVTPWPSPCGFVSLMPTGYGVPQAPAAKPFVNQLSALTNGGIPAGIAGLGKVQTNQLVF